MERVAIGLQDSRAAKSLIELESHIKEEEETLEEIQKNSAAHLISIDFALGKGRV